MQFDLLTPKRNSMQLDDIKSFQEKAQDVV